MRIKKFEATTEREAIEMVKAELGADALVLNIKKRQPKGLFARFRKASVEVTAAYDDDDLQVEETVSKKSSKKNKLSDIEKILEKQHEKQLEKQLERQLKDKKDKKEKKDKDNKNNDNKDNNENPDKPEGDTKTDSVKDKTIVEQGIMIESLEKKISTTEELLQKVMNQLTLSKQGTYDRVRKYENNMIQLFYDELVSQGVKEQIAEKILEDVNSIDEEDKIDINLIVKIVYNTIINSIGGVSPIEVKRNRKAGAKLIYIIGPTGVGKTTTIAKLASNFVLSGSMNVGLITADTYRIAAVEQLKTYSEILGIDIGVVYNNSDLLDNIKNMQRNNDIILIDTAGRSHKNSNNLIELQELLSATPNSEKYLVLSVTTKYEDLINIINAYSAITDFKIIFTKLDETSCYGSILNICYLTGKTISYVTFGQSVPDDMEVAQPEKIAKALLGLGGGIF